MRITLTISLIILLFSPHSLTAQDSLNMRLLYNWQDTTLPAAPIIRNIYNEVWGWHDPVKNREYAIIGSTNGTHFIDVTDHNDMKEVAYVAGNTFKVVHRDYKNKDNYLFAVSDEKDGTLQVIDMAFLPDSVSVVYDSGVFFEKSHNIWVDGDRLYACIPRPAWSPLVNGLAIYDISDPAAPSVLQEYESISWPWGNIHDLYVRNDTAYLNAEERGLFVVDFSDPAMPAILTNLSIYPFQGYNHSGWLSEGGNHYIMADETHGMPLKLLEVSDLGNIEVESYLFPEMTFPIQDTNAIAHNPLFKDNYVFSSYYYDGVYVFDVSDPSVPTIAGFYDTYPDTNAGQYHGNWGVYPFLPSGLILASDMQTGLYVLEFTPPGTSIDNLLEQISLSIFPNPATDEIHLWSSMPLTNPQLILTDMLGRTVCSKHLAGRYERMGWEWSVKPQPGVYILQVLQDDRVVEAGKIMIE